MLCLPKPRPRRKGRVELHFCSSASSLANDNGGQWKPRMPGILEKVGWGGA
jgi:hypothetical protein